MEPYGVPYLELSMFDKDGIKETIHNSICCMLQMVDSTEEQSLLQSILSRKASVPYWIEYKFNCFFPLLFLPSLQLVVGLMPSLLSPLKTRLDKLWPIRISPLYSVT